MFLWGFPPLELKLLNCSQELALSVPEVLKCMYCVADMKVYGIELAVCDHDCDPGHYSYGNSCWV